jgi:hypothetical protein
VQRGRIQEKPLPTFRPLFLVASALLILNLVDAIFTLMWITAGVANEGNPIMDQALSGGPVGFMVVKLSLVSLGVALLWRLRHRRAAAVAMIASATAYGSLCLYHLAAVTHMVAST